MRYVALGDSYTVGTSVAAADRWPDQAVVALGPAEPRLELVANLGVNGYTSADLIRDGVPAGSSRGCDRSSRSVLIGVNDVVQGVPLETYAANVERILDALLVRLPADRLVSVATPDCTVTPAGADYGDPRQQHDGIVAVNETMARLAADPPVSAWVDTVRPVVARRPGLDRSSRATASTQAVPSTRSGSPASRPSSRCSSLR